MNLSEKISLMLVDKGFSLSPKKNTEEPGMSVILLEIKPPVHDSAKDNLSLFFLIILDTDISSVTLSVPYAYSDRNFNNSFLIILILNPVSKPVKRILTPS